MHSCGGYREKNNIIEHRGYRLGASARESMHYEDSLGCEEMFPEVHRCLGAEESPPYALPRQELSRWQAAALAELGQEAG